MDTLEATILVPAGPRALSRQSSVALQSGIQTPSRPTQREAIGASAQSALGVSVELEHHPFFPTSSRSRNGCGAQWYGQCLAKDHDISGKYQDDGEYHGFQVRLHKRGWRSINVSSVTLKELMTDLERVDCLDVDIEGQELPVIRSTVEEMSAKVRRVHIGTHSLDIEAELRHILSSHGWCSVRDYSINTTQETPWGRVEFGSGVQSWVNPRVK